MLPCLDTFERILPRTLLVLTAGVVLIVALIAMACKIVVLEPKELPGGTLSGIAAILPALTPGYYLVRRGRREKGDPDPEGKG